jgi:hypothetical protein
MTNDEKKPAETTAATNGKIVPKDIKPGLKVMCSIDGDLGTVDHMQGPITVKLQKDPKGVHHYIPLSWVTRVDSTVHLDRPGVQAMQEWSIEPPAKA